MHGHGKENDMPINLLTGKKYVIDYRGLSEELMELPIFHTKSIQNWYVKQWIKVLKEADEDSVASYFSLENAGLVIKEKVEAPELFQLPVNWNLTSAYIHFRVSRIIQLLKMSGIDEKNSITIDINEFITGERINWTKTDVDEIEDDKKKEPIIIVPFTIGETYRELVIDGNHRITSAIYSKLDSINAYCISSESLVNNHLFGSRIDELLYIFQNEIVWMGSFYGNKQVTNEKMLASEAYFLTGKINVLM